MVATSAAHGLLVASQSTTTTAPDISIGHVLLQMVIALLVVVGGIWGFSKIMRRGGRFGATAGRGRHKAPVPGLTVLSRQPIGKGKSIAVVQAGSRRFLVGISESGLNPLGEIEPNDDPVSANGDLLAGNGMAGDPRPASGIAAAASWLDGLREATVRR
ncbi:MAG TPA: flagellar biosynthetic protein FliO [Acidimicrobiales bacterium]